MTVKKVTKIEKEFIEKQNNKEETKSKLRSQLVTLRIPENLLEEIDAQVHSKPLKTSRNAWILGVIYKNLKDSKNIED